MVVKSNRRKSSSSSCAWRIKLPHCTFFIFLVSVCALITSTNPSRPSPYITRNPLSAKNLAKFYPQEINNGDDEEDRNRKMRREMRGMGSWPPRCKSKCGRCTPCKPVHVPVPPGTPVTAEYYPEAWRCKCGDHLYMP